MRFICDHPPKLNGKGSLLESIKVPGCGNTYSTCATSCPLWCSAWCLYRRSVTHGIDRMASSSQLCGVQFSHRAAYIQGSIIDSSISLLQQQERDVIPFAMGCPGPETIPLGVLRDIAEQVLRDQSGDALNYGPTEGERTMRSALLEFLAPQGKEIDPGRMLITSGGMQGIDLVCKLFVDPGDLVVVESPTYTNGIATIRSYQGELLEIPTDDDGLVVEAIPELVGRSGRRPKAFYVIPNAQNPRGVTLSLVRRTQLLELAYRYRALVLEDDPYGLLMFSGEALPSLLDLDNGRGHVVAIHTFSKILAPGLRVGWVLGANSTVRRMVSAKQGMDTCTNVLGQRMVASFLERRLMHEHLRMIRGVYLKKKDALQTALRTWFGNLPDVVWTDPAGGFFLWLTLPVDTDATRLFPIALREGVAFIPGSAFSRSGAFGNASRVCFAHPTLAQIPEGVRRLRAAFDAISMEPKEIDA